MGFLLFIGGRAVSVEVDSRKLDPGRAPQVLRLRQKAAFAQDDNFYSEYSFIGTAPGWLGLSRGSVHGSSFAFLGRGADGDGVFASSGVRGTECAVGLWVVSRAQAAGA